MPELRYNPLADEWVIIATERAARPESFKASEAPKADAKKTDPFAYGNEEMTPPEVYAVGPKHRQPNTPEWRVRVVPNKFAALSREIIPAAGFLKSVSGINRRTVAYGAHEVVISSPDGSKSIGQLEQSQVELIVDTYQKRYRVLAKDKLSSYIQIICNHGKTAGASLAHPHSQIFTIPVVPTLIRAEQEQMVTYNKEHKRHLHTDLLKSVSDNRTLVYENDHFVVFCPPWARGPFTTWIVPRDRQAQFENVSDEARKSFAKALRMMLQKLYLKLGDPAYNFYIRTLPVSEAKKAKSRFVSECFWYLECLPRLSIQAGFEYGTGIFINTMAPERAAEFLRER